MTFRVVCALFLVSLAPAATVPNRFVVELATEPLAVHMASTTGSRVNLQSAAALTHRARIAQEQAQTRTGLLQRGAQVLDQVDTVANALLVQTSDADPAPWANLPNVLRVVPVHTVDMVLDRAVVVNRVIDAWTQIGGPANAGLGIKIGIIDSGIDVGHPGFQNSPLVTPASFPLVNSTSDVAFTNNKVVVARSYVSLLQFADPDRSARDHVGHGTALAMISAGGTVTAPAATMTGIAPGAFLGNYKVFGTPGYNDSATDDAILKALDDAVKDGMDVVNLSLGSDIVSRLADDVEVQAVERATQAGVLVVVAAGNNGTDSSTVSSPGTAPDAITVGGQQNDRTFAASVQASGLAPLLAILGNGPTPASPITAQVVDVETLDGNGLACNALPSGSLTNKIALILRGTCQFQVKLKNAAAAGATAGIVYAATSAPDPISMDVGTATLPAEMISFPDGTALKQAVAAGTASVATETFTLSSVSIDPLRLYTYSAAGPDVDYSIKPDLVAVADNYYVATQSYDPNGDMYSPNGYILVGGTSFATPTVAGTAALLKAARPGLTAQQYRSLLINSATPVNFQGAPARVQQVGSGSLNAAGALRQTAAAFPTSLSFGAGGASPQATLNLTVSNASAAADTFTIRVSPTGSSPALSFSADSVRLEAGASATVAVTLSAGNLQPGGYEGYVLVSGSSGGELRIPYWYGVTSTTPVLITDLGSIISARRNSTQTDAILFHVADATGVPITSANPQVTVTAGGGTVVSVQSYDSDSPGLYSVKVRLGAVAGVNTFHVTAGSVAADFNITGQ